MSQLEVTNAGPVAILTLTRPDHGNRMTADMADAVTTALEAADADPAIGACVITGHGSEFCLGGDYQGAGPTAADREDYARALIGMDRAMASVGKPLVAAVNGNAHAGGFGVVIGCDLAVAAQDATFGLPEAAEGLFPFIALAIVKTRCRKNAVRPDLRRSPHGRARSARSPPSTRSCRVPPSCIVRLPSRRQPRATPASRRVGAGSTTTCAAQIPPTRSNARELHCSPRSRPPQRKEWQVTPQLKSHYRATKLELSLWNT